MFVDVTSTNKYIFTVLCTFVEATYLSLVIVNYRHFSTVNGILHIRNTLGVKISVIVHSKLGS